MAGLMDNERVGRMVVLKVYHVAVQSVYTSGVILVDGLEFESVRKLVDGLEYESVRKLVHSLEYESVHKLVQGLEC